MALIAFYAPLKPPNHRVPSGDRRVARLFLDALRLAGHEPFIASGLRSFDGIGDPDRQARLAARGREIAAQLVDRWRNQPQTAPDLWFTYHLYYKAPDWIGPDVCAAIGIPYIVAEASLAMKRAEGPWAAGHRAVAAALRQADLVVGLNPADRDGVLPALRAADCWAALAPFLDTGAYSAAPRQIPAAPRLVTVAMMRRGDKLASYRVLAAALAQLLDRAWTLEVVGDGPAQAEAAAALAPLGGRIRFSGALDEAEIAARLAGSDFFVWPAINEAFGMALLEAQASGLAVVAGNSGGVGEIVGDGTTGLLVPPGDAGAFAAAVRSLIEDPARCARLGAAARQKALREHDLTVAADRLATMVAALRRVRAA
jgi:glycosyltransferase involved in cell wall biosynthesis